MRVLNEGGVPTRLRTREQGYVYLIGVTERALVRSPLKIGIATNPKRRLAELQIGSPFKLEVIRTWRFPTLWAAEGVEQKFHRAHRASRSHGEWVHISQEDAELRIQQLFVEYWQIKKRRSQATGEDYYLVGNMIAVGNSLTRAQIQKRRSAYLAGLRR